ncbi:sigma-54-dependent transcriptional regulator [Desulfoscipio gibsoniae]|uniref:Stage 0 sporulation protein A homolog n=1 Tax=Desulfoscipio gibsoniae DSM 7213 TaxID=767817 RepID=R4KMW2_9FIRM|nr:sigma-54 dependent transcriptional regulator [Desulfoscipio gibsoniae]AGL02912.1 response regulator with CheY-like receiver, AAA-type ATPase, and DNA-binding domains [Desulfoscipio gibsoniae DSM 7213]
MKPQILVIDDEVEVGTFFAFFLEEQKNCQVTVANSGSEALKAISNSSFHLALVDLKLPDNDGISLLKEIKNRQPFCPVIIMTGYSTVKSAVQAVKLGAFDYIEKPFDELDQLEASIDRALGKYQIHKDIIDSELLQEARNLGIITNPDSPLFRILSLAQKIAPKNITVLLSGETGTGKEVLARFTHFNSSRANKPFLGVNCGAFTETLLESELFGHEKGSFTGAHGTRKGIFEIADGGTLFLDEIGEASPTIQVKLLRVLETGEFIRVGGETTRKTNTRIVAATNINLRDAVSKGKFRQDLFYRLDVVSLNLPPLRERVCDIPLLVEHFIAKNTEEKIRCTPETLELLKAYSWPGNVRELSNVITRAIAFSSSDYIGVESLPEKITGIKLSSYPPINNKAMIDLECLINWWGGLLPPLLVQLPNLDLERVRNSIKDVEAGITRKVIEHFLQEPGSTYSGIAQKLGITPRVLRYLIKEKGK